MNIESQSIKELSLALIDASAKIGALEEALSRIYNWDEISLEDRIDIGSDGQKTYYRSIAKLALNSKPEELKQLSGEG